MSKIKTLDRYTDAIIAIGDWKDKHKKLFKELDSLRIEAAEAEAALKEDVKDNHQTDIKNDQVRVTYSTAYRKWYDIDVIKEMITPKQKKALESVGAYEVKLDKAKFEDLVEKGVIPVEVKQKAFMEKELAPRVSIKEIKE